MKNLATFLLFISALFAYGQTPERLRLLLPPDRMTIVFSGDYMQHMPQVTAAKCDSGYNYDSQLARISPLWRDANFSIINLETTLSNSAPYSGYPMFRSPSQCVFALRRAGVTHAAMANNHVVDRSKEGVRRTTVALDSAGIKYFGAGFAENYYTFLERGALKVAVINGTYGTNGINVPKGVYINSSLDTAMFSKQIDEVRELGATHIITFVHWGNEYQLNPSKEQKKLAMWFREKGVNLVVGSHPHVVQPIDRDNNIVYSLGNFISNQTKTHTDTGCSVRITIVEGYDDVSIEHLTHFVDLSPRGGDKYRVLPLRDTSLIENKAQRTKMKNAILRAEKILNSTVKYE